MDNFFPLYLLFTQVTFVCTILYEGTISTEEEQSTDTCRNWDNQREGKYLIYSQDHKHLDILKDAVILAVYLMVEFNLNEYKHHVQMLLREFSSKFCEHCRNYSTLYT